MNFYNNSKQRYPLSALNQVFRIMRLIIVFLTIGLLQVNASVFSQSITLSLNNAPLEEVIRQIREQSGYDFIGDSKLINKASPITVDFKNVNIKEALAFTLKGQNLTYIIKDEIVIIKGLSPKSLSKTKTAGIEVQDIVVRGKITDGDQRPLGSVSIKIKGTNEGTSSDSQGNYTLSVPENSIIVFTYVGHITEEVPVNGRSVINISLQDELQSLSEVVVTALGIKREAKSLTYATQRVSSEEITKVKDPSFMNSLAGKAAGVVITKGNAGPGASTRVVLRGNKSITGNNQPLYVIDGIPMNNSASSSSNTLFSQQDFGDAISNLNQDDIENIEILKGASAAALYGSQAANGVILVTTKRGAIGSSKIDFSSSLSIENNIGLPVNQTTYGQVLPGISNESWGTPITNGNNSHIQDFFRTGKDYLNSLSISTGNETGQLYISYANTKANGTVVENDLSKHNVNLRGTSQILNDKLSLDASVNYIHQIVHNRPQSGYYLSPIFSLYLFPTGDDFSKYSGSNYEIWDPVRLLYKQNWPYIVNEASSNQNPYWIQNRNQNDLIRERSLSTFSAKYTISHWLDFQGRVTYDKVQDSYEQRISATTDPVLAHANGGYTKNSSDNSQLYSDFLLSGNGNVNEDIAISTTIGYTLTKNKASGMNFSSVTSTGLSYPNFFSIYGLRFPFNSSESLRRQMNQSVLGTVSLAYKDKIFLDATGRNEWSSTVQESFFYPSIGLSYIVLEGFEDKGIFSFAKFRGSYSEVGNALPFRVANRSPRYSLSNDENINPRGTLPYFNGTDTISLQPERTRSFEFGADMRFLNNKLALNLTYYNATTYNQVFTIGAPAGSGASNFYINGGTIRNKGVEGIITYQGNFGNLKWNPSVNLSRNVNQIIELSDLLTTPRFVLTDINSTRQVQLFLTRPVDGKYGSYGDLYGKKVQYGEDGKIVVDKNGLPLLSANPDEYIGNANPDFLLGFNNSFTYKRASLSFLIDGRFGGKIFSVTETWRDWKGLSKRTAEARDNGGVLVNDQLVDAEAYYKRISGSGQQGAAEMYTFDATNVRLREIALGYTIPSFTRAIKNLNVSLVSRNLFFIYNNAPFDPEVSIAPANGLQGIEGFNLPSTRSFGLTVKATF